MSLNIEGLKINKKKAPKKLNYVPVLSLYSTKDPRTERYSSVLESKQENKERP